MRSRLAIVLVCALEATAFADDPTPDPRTAPTDAPVAAPAADQVAVAEEPPARRPIRIAPITPVVSAAHAAEPPAPPPTFSIMFNPALTIVSVAMGGIGGIGELEVRVHDHAGVSVFAAGAQLPDILDTGTTSVLLGGVKAHWYPLRPFSGIHAGALGAVGHASTTGGRGPFWTALPGAANIVETGGFGGWKYVSPSGFTFVAQLGAVLGVGRNTDTGKTVTDVFPYLDLNIGWSL